MEVGGALVIKDTEVSLVSCAFLEGKIELSELTYEITA